MFLNFNELNQIILTPIQMFQSITANAAAVTCEKILRGEFIERLTKVSGQTSWTIVNSKRGQQRMPCVCRELELFEANCILFRCLRYLD